MRTSAISDRWELLGWLAEMAAGGWVRWACEEFRLYPGKAAAQSWSDMYTPRVIGGIEAVAELVGAQVVFQPASVKRAGFAQAERLGWALDQRSQHERDAVAHLAVATRGQPGA